MSAGFLINTQALRAAVVLNRTSQSPEILHKISDGGMLATNCYRGTVVSSSDYTASSKVLLLYYAATVIFLILDYALGFNVRLAFLEPYADARLAYYGVCFFCLGLMLWRPAWTVLIAAFESILTLSALIISMGMRTLVVSDQMLESGGGLVTMPEIVNFLLSGGAAYLAWIRGIRRLRHGKLH